MTAALLVIAANLFAAIRAQDVAKVESILAQEPALAAAQEADGGSAVSAALFVTDGESFVPHARNRVLQALLRRQPQLTPFEACAVGTADQVRAALAKDPALVKARTSIGWTPLHYAAFADNAPALSLLLAAGAAVDSRASNRFDNTPLQVAMLTSSRAAAELLIRSGADVNAKQGEGLTALHEAASTGDLALIRMLLAAGAERAPKSSLGTPRDLAAKHGHASAVRLLEEP